MDITDKINLVLIAILVFATIYYAREVAKQTRLMREEHAKQTERIRMEQDVKEMECLVGRLYSRLYTKRSAKTVFAKLSPERMGGTGEGVEEHFRFWDKIEHYVYLGSRDLRLSINKYIESNLGTDSEYENAKADLIKEIEKRHSDLTEKISTSSR